MTAALALLLSASASLARDEIEVVAEGTSPYVIALPEGAGETKIAQAAELLRSTIVEATGVEIPFLAESEVPSGAPAICLGPTETARAAGLPTDGVESNG